jgi:hypothetical protein
VPRIQHSRGRPHTWGSRCHPPCSLASPVSRRRNCATQLGVCLLLRRFRGAQRGRHTGCACYAGADAACGGSRRGGKLKGRWAARPGLACAPAPLSRQRRHLAHKLGGLRDGGGCRGCDDGVRWFDGPRFADGESRARRRLHRLVDNIKIHCKRPGRAVG